MLSLTISKPDYLYLEQRALSYMQTCHRKEALPLTQRSVELALPPDNFVIGFIVMKSLADVDSTVHSKPDENFIVSTT